jgi:hypothetical protein
MNGVLRSNNIVVGLAAAEMGEETGMIPEQYL